MSFINKIVKITAHSNNIFAEPSPEGHWSKNFAALSIHRREDWAVTVKGFNHFVWDFEASKTENVYGLFASHGALLIANSEADLEVHGVKNGWHWAKVPGTTTIDMGNPNIDDLKIGKARFFNRLKLAGGLTFAGQTMNLKNGLFGMNFLQPEYGFLSSDWRKQIRFRFKKSVFSFENLLVCLGSGISALNTSGRVAQTTLFQDKLVSGGASSFIKVDGVQKTSSSSYSHTPTTRSYTTLTDAKGNFYYIPNPSKSILHVTVQNQNSYSDDGITSSSGNYATAWFAHGMYDRKYQYAVLIPTTSYHTPLTDLATAQETTASEVYRVLKHDNRANVVQFLKSPNSWIALSPPVTGYVIFLGNRRLPTAGPVKRVSKECFVMVQETLGSIYLSISSPHLNLTGPPYPTNSDDVGEHLLYESASRDTDIKVTLWRRVLAIARMTAHDAPASYTPTVDLRNNGRAVRFRNLRNGFSVEVELTK